MQTEIEKTHQRPAQSKKCLQGNYTEQNYTFSSDVGRQLANITSLKRVLQQNCSYSTPLLALSNLPLKGFIG